MPDRELPSELRHRHQRRRATATILVVILMLFFAFWYAYSYYRDSTGVAAPSGSSGGTATCRPFDPRVAAPANTTVNVYNATTKNGLAARTAADLKRRGFTVGKVSNDPLSRKVGGPAEVRFGPSGKAHSQLVVPLGGKGTTRLPDTRKDTTVDLVLGAKFTALVPTPTPTGKPMCPSPTTSSTAASTAPTSAS